VRAGVPEKPQSATLRELVAPVLAELPPGDGEVVVEGIEFFGTSYASGLVLQLERNGIDAGQPPTKPRRPEELHVYSGGPVRAHLTVALHADVVDLTGRPGLRLVALSGGLTLDELRASVDATKQLEPVVTGETTMDDDQFDALVRAASLPRPAVGVFIEMPPAGP
jgi:hypothetical protein